MQRKTDYFSRQSYERKEKQARGEKLQEMRTKQILKARCSSPLFLWYVTCSGALQPRAIATKPLCCCQVQGNSSHCTLQEKKKKKITRFSSSHGHPPGREAQRSFLRQLFCAARGMLAAVDQVTCDSAAAHGCASVQRLQSKRR